MLFFENVLSNVLSKEDFHICAFAVVMVFVRKASVGSSVLCVYFFGIYTGCFRTSYCTEILVYKEKGTLIF